MLLQLLIRCFPNLKRLFLNHGNPSRILVLGVIAAILSPICLVASSSENVSVDSEFLINFFDVLGKDIDSSTESIQDKSSVSLFRLGFSNYKHNVLADPAQALNANSNSFGNMRRLHLGLRMIAGEQTKFGQDELWAVLYPPPSFDGSIDLGIKLSKYRIAVSRAWFSAVSQWAESNDETFRRASYDILSVGKMFLSSSGFEGVYAVEDVSLLTNLFVVCGTLVNQELDMQSVFLGSFERLAKNDFQISKWPAVSLSDVQKNQAVSLFRDLSRTRYFETLKQRKDFSKNQVLMFEAKAISTLNNLRSKIEKWSTPQLSEILLVLESRKIDVLASNIPSYPDLPDPRDVDSWWSSVVIGLGIANEASDHTSEIAAPNLQRLDICISLIEQINNIDPDSGALESKDRIMSEMFHLWEHVFDRLKSSTR